MIPEAWHEHRMIKDSIEDVGHRTILKRPNGVGLLSHHLGEVRRSVLHPFPTFGQKATKWISEDTCLERSLRCQPKNFGVVDYEVAPPKAGSYRVPRSSILRKSVADTVRAKKGCEEVE